MKEEPKIKEEEEVKEEVKEEEDPKKKKIKLIIMGLAGFLGLLLISAIVMYFMGVFDEPEPEPEVKKEIIKKTKKEIVDVVKYTTLKKINFKVSDIDTNRLNNRLLILSKSTILTPQELSADKKFDQNRLEALSTEKEYIEFAKRNKEEVLDDKIINESKQINKVKNKAKDTIPKKIEKFTYLVTNSLQYKLFTTFLTKINSSTATVSICSNKLGETVIYIGSFSTNSKLVNMENLIKKNDKNIEIKRVIITTEEFYSYCN